MNAPAWLDHAIAQYGYWVVLVAVLLETMGVPIPGETALVAAAVYAGTGSHLQIGWVIAFAAIGAITGDNIGFTIGRYGGYPLARRILHALHVRESALDYVRGYFQRYGDKTVFLGRFISILRAYVSLLAGVSQMRRRIFFAWNAAGGVAWALVYGLLGYFLGRNLPLLSRVLRALGIGGVVVAAVAVGGLVVFWLVRRRRAQAAALRRVRAEFPAEQAPGETVSETQALNTAGKSRARRRRGRAVRYTQTKRQRKRPIRK